MDPLRQLEIRRDRRTPLAVQLSGQLRWLITGGHLVGGARLPSIRAFADRLGINLHTVRAAYRHLEEDGLVEVRHGSGAFVLPRDPGRDEGTWRSPPSAVYGVIVPSFTATYQRVLDGAGLAADAAGAMVMAVEARESVARGTRAAQSMIDMGCAGIVVAAPIVDPDRLSRRADEPPRLVVCDWPDGPTPRIDVAVGRGVATAIEHLEEHGHHTIALVAPPSHWENAAPLHAAVADHGERSAHIAVHEFTLQAGLEAATRLVETRPLPTAVIAAGDELARGVIIGLREHRRDVPDDMAVIGIGGDEAGASWAPPTLTTVEIPAHTMGHEAIRLLSAEPFDPGAQIVLDTRLAIHRSCGCHPGSI